MPANVQAVVELSTDGTTYLAPGADRGTTAMMGPPTSAPCNAYASRTATSGTCSNAALVARSIWYLPALRGTRVPLFRRSAEELLPHLVQPRDGLTGTPAPPLPWSPAPLVHPISRRGRRTPPTAMRSSPDSNHHRRPQQRRCSNDIAHARTAVVSSPNALSNNVDYFDYRLRCRRLPRARIAWSQRAHGRWRLARW
jgi:hypothetical protein